MPGNKLFHKIKNKIIHALKILDTDIIEIPKKSATISCNKPNRRRKHSK